MQTRTAYESVRRAKIRFQDVDLDSIHEPFAPHEPLPMCAVRPAEGDPRKPGRDGEADSEDQAHARLPTPRDGAVRSKNHRTPALVEVRVQPFEVMHEVLGLRRTGD